MFKIPWWFSLKIATNSVIEITCVVKIAFNVDIDNTDRIGFDGFEIAGKEYFLRAVCCH